MKDQTNKSHDSGEEKVKLPWEAELEVKDLIKPIQLRRIRLVQTAAAILLLIGIGVFGWWYFFTPPSGERFVKEMITAAGGMEEWKNIEDGNFVRTHRVYDDYGKVIKESEETFFFMNNRDGHQLLIKSKTLKGDAASTSVLTPIPISSCSSDSHPKKSTCRGKTFRVLAIINALSGFM